MFAPLLVLALAPQTTTTTTVQTPPQDTAGPGAPAAQTAKTAPVSPFSYNFIEAGYFRSNLEGVKQDAEGWGIRASYDVVPNVNLIGAFKYRSTDFGSGELEITDYIVGIGSHHAVHPKADAYGSFDFRYQEFDTPGKSENDTGYGITGGIRALPHQRLELDAAITYSYVATSDTELGLLARGYITEKISLGAGVAFSDDATNYTLGLRVNF